LHQALGTIYCACPKTEAQYVVFTRLTSRDAERILIRLKQNHENRESLPDSREHDSSQHRVGSARDAIPTKLEVAFGGEMRPVTGGELRCGECGGDMKEGAAYQTSGAGQQT